MKPDISINVLDATPDYFTLVAPVRLRNLWRVRLGFWLVGLGARVLRSELRIEDEADAGTD